MKHPAPQPAQRLLAELQLLLQMGQKLLQQVVTHAARHDARRLVRPLHDFLPALVDLGEPLGFLGQLLGDVPADEHRFQIHPHVLHQEPSFQNFVRVGEVVEPLVDLFSKGGVVPENGRDLNDVAFEVMKSCTDWTSTTQESLSCPPIDRWSPQSYPPEVTALPCC